MRRRHASPWQRSRQTPSPSSQLEHTPTSTYAARARHSNRGKPQHTTWSRVPGSTQRPCRMVCPQRRSPTLGDRTTATRTSPTRDATGRPEHTPTPRAARPTPPIGSTRACRPTRAHRAGVPSPLRARARRRCRRRGRRGRLNSDRRIGSARRARCRERAAAPRRLASPPARERQTSARWAPSREMRRRRRTSRARRRA